MYPFHIQMATDTYYTAPIALSAHLHSETGSRVWMYVNNYNFSRPVDSLYGHFLPGWMGTVLYRVKTLAIILIQAFATIAICICCLGSRLCREICYRSTLRRLIGRKAIAMPAISSR